MPLFQHEGKIICPSCKKEAVIVGEGKNAIVKFKEEETKEDNQVKVEKTEEDEEVARYHDGDLENILKNAVLKLARILDECKTIDEIKEIVEVLEKIISIIEKARKLRL